MSISLPHPLSALAALLVAQFALQGVVKWWLLTSVTAFIVLLAGYFAAHQFSNMLRRSRWVILSVIVLLAWDRPGVGIVAENWAPTWQGIDAGLQQALRLVVLLGSLAIVLNHYSSPLWLSALHRILSPMRYVGIDVRRAVVRLGLLVATLSDSAAEGSERAPESVSVTLERDQWSWIDCVLICAIIGLLLAV